MQSHLVPLAVGHVRKLLPARLVPTGVRLGARVRADVQIVLCLDGKFLLAEGALVREARRMDTVLVLSQLKPELEPCRTLIAREVSPLVVSYLVSFEEFGCAEGFTADFTRVLGEFRLGMEELFMFAKL